MFTFSKKWIQCNIAHIGKFRTQTTMVEVLIFPSRDLWMWTLKNEKRKIIYGDYSWQRDWVLFCLFIELLSSMTPQKSLFQMSIYTIPAGIVVVMATAGVCSSVPPTPPTASAAETSQPFFKGLKMVSRHARWRKHNVLLLIVKQWVKFM